jgi:hypothetical protein
MSTKKVCPHCGSNKVANILYGYPGEDAMAAADQGEVVLGGCCVSSDDPNRACTVCGSEWAASTDLTTTEISRQFAESFSGWDIALPPGAEAAEARGVIFKDGWRVNYIFGRSDEKYIEFYATHRMTEDDRQRIYESGKVESLDTVQGMYMYDPKVPGSEEEARRRNLEHNQRVDEELHQLGIYPDGDINAYLRTHEVPPRDST